MKKELLINHYVDKKLITSIIHCDSLKMEIRSKMLVLVDNENVVFACKIADFVSLQY